MIFFDYQSTQCFMKKTVLLILILGCLLYSCDTTDSTMRDQDTPLEYNTLLERFETETFMNEFRTVVIENHTDVEEFLSEYPTDEFTAQKLANVSYSDSLVYGVFVGSRPNSSYSVRIDSIITEGAINHFYIKETGSASGNRVISWPAHFITIKKTDYGNRSIGGRYIRICTLEPCSWPVSNAPG